MKHWFILFCAGLLLSCGCSSISLQDNSFNLASFNIRCPIDPTPNTWDERRPRCLAVIKANQLDIFGVQEAFRHQLDDLIGEEFAYIGCGRDDFKDAGEFSAILYKKARFELIKGGTFGLSEKPDVPGYMSWNTACPRIATWGFFKDKKSGKTFIYYNTHLDHVSELARVNGIKLIVDHARKNAAGHPLVLSGDFNANVGSVTYKTAESLLKNSEIISKSPHTGPVNTFHGYGRSKGKSPIDFIFVSEDFKVLSHKTDDTRFPEGFPSDHYPVVTKLLLK